MTKTINICYISGNIFKTISYSDINNLRNKLQDLLEEYNKDTYIQLILNNIFINIGDETNYFDFYNCEKNFLQMKLFYPELSS